MREKMNEDNENDLLTKKLEIGKKVIFMTQKIKRNKFNNIKKKFGTLNKSINLSSIIKSTLTFLSVQLQFWVLATILGCI